MSNRPSIRSNNKPINVRVAVINTLLAIQQGQSLSSLLDPLLNSLEGGNENNDKGFAHALLLTTLRHWHATARLLDTLADAPIEQQSVRTTIQLGITQLLYLNVADHAAINETVDAVKLIDAPHASGLTNAILRKVAKNPNKFRKKASKKHSLPNWLAMQLKIDWREQYDELTQALRQPAPMFLRVNELQTTVADYADKLAEEDIAIDVLLLTAAWKLSDDTSADVTLNDGSDGLIMSQQTALRLQNSMPVSQLPEFETGIASVQDAHAQLAAPIIHSALNSLALQNKREPTKPIRLLDACAAPGGKLAHWLELLGIDETKKENLFHVKPYDAKLTNQTPNKPVSSIDIFAIDNEPNRISRIFENLDRLELPAPIVNTRVQLDIEWADATVWQGSVSDREQVADTEQSEIAQSGLKEKLKEEHQAGFDAILLDAPCTATGVIRRHPDITLLRHEEDIPHTIQLQEQILDNLWSILNVGGYFLYVTCSILKAENVEQMQAFLTRHNDAIAIEFDDKQTNWGLAQAVGRQCLPLNPEGGDGFYYALLRKV